jgi:SAM-dependent methyltransferase
VSPPVAVQRPCPSCGSESARALRRYSEHLLVRCEHCKLVYTGCLPSESELRDYYSVYPENTRMSELTLRRYDELLSRLEPFRETGRLLDIGCGDGHLLAAAREHGWATYGSEFGEGPRRRALEQGLDVRPAPFPATDDEVGSFDVVISIEVIEHVTDPREEVEGMRMLLRPGGCAYLTTPNFNSLTRRTIGARWRVIEYPEHLNYFTPGTLDRLLVGSGLSKLELKTTGISPRDISAGLRPTHGCAGSTNGCGSGDVDARVRERMTRSPLLERSVRLVNAALSQSGLGDTIKALYRLP